MATTVTPNLTQYNVTPTAGTGSGTAYGKVPGATDIPPSTYAQLSSVIPGLSNLTGTAASTIGSELAGTVPTDVIKNIQDQAAAWGVSSGMPGSGLAQNLALRNLGLTSLSQQQAGLTNYGSLTSNLASEMLSPSLLTSLSQSNAALAAAPDPLMAQQQMMQDYLSYLNPASGSGSLSSKQQAQARLTMASQPNLTPQMAEDWISIMAQS
jgi:hypothetical protein